MNAANMFMSALYVKYRETPIFSLPDAFIDKNGLQIPLTACTEEAMFFLILLISAVVCSGTVRRPNILLVFGSTFPLAEICLYFGLVPNYAAFAALLCCWCGALAAEITEFGKFADREADRLFAKTSAQSAWTAAVIMLMAFSGALLYADAVEFERSEKADKFRSAYTAYMRDFSWKKFTEDIKDALTPASGSSATHDGKLGNVESVEFSGKNMLEVTLPENAGTLYLKGFTGSEYTGSRWNEGPALPPLETKLSSPEFFSGRTLKYIPEFNDLRSLNVIVRNTGISSSVKYYPVNAAGLLETDGKRRRYGVYFPESSNWRKTVIISADSLKLPEELSGDEDRLRSYAYTYCLDVPDSFTAAHDFFADYNGNTLYDELTYIRTHLSDLCEYSLESGKKPFGSDFAQWFLTENRKGSCTHFASTAVLLCRSRGIPARYCEGFIVKNEDIADYTADDGYVTVSVPDNRAHAWAEIYIDGYGWLSFEATPGYGNVALEASAENWEGAATSEITTVTTETPRYSEHITETTSVTFTGSEPANENESTITTVETEITVTVTEISASNENSPLTSATSGTAVTSDASSSLPPNETEADGTDITEATTMPPSSVSADRIPESLHPAAAVVFIIALISAMLFLRRYIILAHRRRLVAKAPHKAAAEIYHMLVRLADADTRKTPSEELPAALHEACGFDKEQCTIIVQTALKARFGEGITAEEASISAAAYNSVFKAADRSDALKIICKIIFCTDIYTDITNKE